MRPKLILAALVAALMLTTAGPADAATPQLDRAARTVQRNSERYPGSRANRIAWATFRYVNSTIRSERGTRIPIAQWSASLEDAIRLRAGACGTATHLSLEIADRLGIKARPVEFYYTETDGSIGSHIMPEFYVDGGWRLYDVLFNTVYRSPRTHRLLSATELHAMPYRSALRRQQKFPDVGRDLFVRGAFPWKAPHNPFRYLADPRSEMTINDTGTVTMGRVGAGWAPTHDRPGYIGKTTTFGKRTGTIAQRLVGTGDMRQIRVLLTSGCRNGRIVARSQITTTASLDPSTTLVTLPVSGSSVSLSVQGGCYAVIHGVSD